MTMVFCWIDANHLDLWGRKHYVKILRKKSKLKKQILLTHEDNRLNPSKINLKIVPKLSKNFSSNFDFFSRCSQISFLFVKEFNQI